MVESVFSYQLQTYSFRGSNSVNFILFFFFLPKFPMDRICYLSGQFFQHIDPLSTTGRN